MTNKKYAIIGFLAPAIFGVTYFIMAGRRPEYSFLYKQVSELGALDAPNKWLWNIFGYIIPGILMSVFSIGLYKAIVLKKGSKLPVIGMFMSAIFMAFSGAFPANMDDRSSVTTVLHMVGSYGSYLFFLIGTFTYPKLMRKNPYWRSSTNPLLIFVWVTILFGGWYYVFPDYPSVGQRVTFFFYFAWIILTSYKLYSQPDRVTN